MRVVKQIKQENIERNEWKIEFSRYNPGCNDESCQEVELDAMAFGGGVALCKHGRGSPTSLSISENIISIFLTAPGKVHIDIEETDAVNRLAWRANAGENEGDM